MISSNAKSFVSEPDAVVRNPKPKKIQKLRRARLFARFGIPKCCVIAVSFKSVNKRKIRIDREAKFGWKENPSLRYPIKFSLLLDVTLQLQSQEG